MAEAAFDLQRKIKGNTETFQDYLTQLYHWEEEIKKTDQELKTAAQNFTPDHVSATPFADGRPFYLLNVC
jgi:hypothetical protein